MRSIATPASAVNPKTILSVSPTAIPAPASDEPRIVPHLVITGFRICCISNNCTFYSFFIRRVKCPNGL